MKIEQVSLMREELYDFEKWAKKKKWKIIRVIKLTKNEIIVLGRYNDNN